MFQIHAAFRRRTQCVSTDAKCIRSFYSVAVDREAKRLFRQERILIGKIW